MPNASLSCRVSCPGHVSYPSQASHPRHISPVSHNPSIQISLLPGQVQGLALARATVLGVSTGELVLTRRIRLDTDVLVVKTRLSAGAVFIAQQPEWVELTSLCVAEVWVRPAVAQVGQHHPALWRPFKWPKFAALAQFAAKARVAKPTTRF